MTYAKRLPLIALTGSPWNKSERYWSKPQTCPLV
jgi:hypothetical protein